MKRGLVPAVRGFKDFKTTLLKVGTDGI